MPAKPKLKIWNVRFLELMHFMIASKKVKDQKEFCKIAEYGPTNIRQLRTGQQGITQDHIQRLCIYYDLTSDWFYGFTDDMNRKVKAKTALQLLKEAAFAVELEMINHKK